jgi:hypothetical protein
VIIAYDEHDQALQVCTIHREPIARRIESALVVPWPLADEGFKLDDEFARKIGGLVFNLLAVHQPELKSYISVTPHPDTLNRPPPTDQGEHS